MAYCQNCGRHLSEVRSSMSCPCREINELANRIADRLRLIHFDGTGCGVEADHPCACSNCFGPSPMSADAIGRDLATMIAGGA